MRTRLLRVSAIAALLVGVFAGQLAARPAQATGTLAACGQPNCVYFPLVEKSCTGVTGNAYTLGPYGDNTFPVIPGTNDGIPAGSHPDVNPLPVRGYVRVTGRTLGLVDISSTPNDPKAPQLGWMFTPERKPTILNTYQVNGWNWGSPPTYGAPGSPIANPDVTLIGMQPSSYCEIVRVPDRKGLSPNDYVSDANQFQVLVLYADSNRITLKYTGEDNIVQGYGIHIDNIVVDPTLINRYNQMNAAGRSRLPALQGLQPIGTARNGQEIRVSVRDTGSFMDPRSWRDWWDGFTFP